MTTLSEHRRTLAHELFHAWNPQRLGGFEVIGGVEDERLYWFSEGFTDYYASVLLLRAGLISLEDYVAGYNSLIKEYYTSPIRLLTAAEMVRKRQTSYEVDRLFYKRGALLAHYWDNAIRSRTNNKSSLDDVMRSLLKSAKARGVSLSHKRIADAVRPYLGEKGASDIEKYIDRGELVPADNFFGTCAIAEVINYHPWDMGFEAETSFKTRVISGVVPDSNAHRAGLRDGQKWVSGGFVWDDPTRLTKLTVIEGDTQKVVQFYPAATEAIRLPQFKLKPDLSAEERRNASRSLVYPRRVQDCGNNASQENIGEHHRAGVAACLYRRAETAKGPAGGPECVGNFAINRRPGLRGSGRDAGLQFRPRTLGDPWRHPGWRSWTSVRSGKPWRAGRQDSTGSYRA